MRLKAWFGEMPLLPPARTGRRGVKTEIKSVRVTPMTKYHILNGRLGPPAYNKVVERPVKMADGDAIPIYDVLGVGWRRSRWQRKGSRHASSGSTPSGTPSRIEGPPRPG